MFKIERRALQEAIKGTKRSDYLAIVEPNGEVFYFPSDRVLRALKATAPLRMGTEISWEREGLDFVWRTGGLRLSPNPGRYVNKRSGRRTIQEWKPFTGALRPAIFHLAKG